MATKCSHAPQYTLYIRIIGLFEHIKIHPHGRLSFDLPPQY